VSLGQMSCRQACGAQHGVQDQTRSAIRLLLLCEQAGSEARLCPLAARLRRRQLAAQQDAAAADGLHSSRPSPRLAEQQQVAATIQTRCFAMHSCAPDGGGGSSSDSAGKSGDGHPCESPGWEPACTGIVAQSAAVSAEEAADWLGEAAREQSAPATGQQSHSRCRWGRSAQLRSSGCCIFWTAD